MIVKRGVYPDGTNRLHSQLTIIPSPIRTCGRGGYLAVHTYSRCHN